MINLPLTLPSFTGEVACNEGVAINDDNGAAEGGLSGMLAPEIGESAEVSQASVEKALSRSLGEKTNVVVYVDGAPAAVKDITTTKRQKDRIDSELAPTHLMQEMVDCVQRERWPKRQLERSFLAALKRCFRLSPDQKHALAEYLRSQGWTVIEAEFEADVRTAQDCGDQDIVVSSDSDMIAYSSVKTVWRPVSGYRFLVYPLERVLSHMNLSRRQLTVLTIVSQNVYSANVKGLGSKINLSIIKSTNDAEDIRSMINEYLNSTRVINLNTTDIDFEIPQQVFVYMVQTPSALPPLDVSGYDVLRTQY
ncbi:hypothetical protein KVV02_007334 [Mortierella alpina]|uniref:Uncharacterized protein n=1 Tax=Mortierella alpina TaxID=64518 RepID=A0A9P8A1H5_MORAP|nr:hypothetical protein KVV02_007334 [Mortierella alpina]